MPQTGSTTGHAHNYDEGEEFTSTFDTHRHRVLPRGFRTGFSLNIQTGKIEDEHSHELPDRIVRETPRQI